MKLIAFYLPQYHPIPENDAWWGKGFTEWTNVAKCQPRFRGHYQPHVPADLGFYDLRVEETRIAQAEMARRYGIHGFCYYHYWFNGKMLLERPLNEVLASGRPDFPFCICWANENWTKNWSGENKQVLMQQQHSYEDDLSHIEWLIKAFSDERYIRIQGKPLLLIYRTDLIPHAKEMVSLWKAKVREAGFPDLFLCAVKNNFAVLNEREMLDLGFDALIEFQPNKTYIPPPRLDRRIVLKLSRMINEAGKKVFSDEARCLVPITSIHSYKQLVVNAVKGLKAIGKRVYPTVIPAWDNSPRRKDGARILANDNADLYQTWLEEAMASTEGFAEEERLVFINAWNEWAEGCHLEPDLRNGHKFLEATHGAVTNYLRANDTGL